MDDEMLASISDSLKEVEKASVKEPLILINNNGSFQFNHHAEDFISERKIPVKDFMEWLTIGSLHLQNLSYGDVSISMMRLPGDRVIAFLKKNDEDQNIEKLAFTCREKEVLGYVAKGFSNKEIGTFMKISSGTVNSYLDKIYMKLGCSTRVEASFLGLKNGLFLPVCKRLEKKRHNKNH